MTVLYSAKSWLVEYCTSQAVCVASIKSQLNLAVWDDNSPQLSVPVYKHEGATLTSTSSILK